VVEGHTSFSDITVSTTGTTTMTIRQLSIRTPVRPAQPRNGQTPQRTRPELARKLATLFAGFLCPVLAAAGLQDPAKSLPPFAPSADIPCDGTPFGYQLTLGRDAEMVTLVPYNQGAANGDLGRLREWALERPPGNNDAPPFPVMDTIWTVPHFAGTDLMHALRTDLNGDGTDEVWVAAGWPAGSNHSMVRIGQFQRTSPDSNQIDLAFANELGTFSGGQTQFSNQFEFATGNVLGHDDGIRDLVMMTRMRNNNHVRISVAPGRADGGLEPGGWRVWTFVPPTSQVGQVGIAVGDFLLKGRDQIVLVTETDHGGNGLNRKLNYHFLQAQDGSPDLEVQTFTTPVSNIFGHSNGDDTISNTGIRKMTVDAGDVAGSAAAELVIHMEYLPQGSDGNVVGQRVHHFRYVRNANGDITGIEMARPAGAPPHVDYDYSHIVRTQHSTWGDWAVAVGNVDHDPKAEIVFTHDVVRQDTHFLDTSVYKVDYQLTAAFRYWRSGRSVRFTDISVGGGPGPFPYYGGSRWTFGDGNSSDDINPVHTFQSNGARTVRLNIQQDWNGTNSYSYKELTINIDADANEGGGELDPEQLLFQIQRDPVYRATYARDENNSSRFNHVNVSVDDMNRDGIPEIMSVASYDQTSFSPSGMVHSIWNLQNDNSLGLVLQGEHRFEYASGTYSNSGVHKVFALGADLDGDSVFAEVGTDCRRVEETQARNLIWIPPHFERLQDGASRSASIGRTTGGGSSVESRYGTFTSHDVSAYVGINLGVEPLGLGANIKATAGYNVQAAHGAMVGSENAHALSQAHSQEQGDGLLVTETNRFNCYLYDVRQANAGVDPDSMLRICERIVMNGATGSISASDPGHWDRHLPLEWAQVNNGNPPPSWTPLNRDWANIALFRPVSSNASFLPGAGAENATDGHFSTPVKSTTRVQPYVEIDLGGVHDVTNIRVFPANGELAAGLRGFRVYASTTPMPANGIPSGPDVRVFQPENVMEMVYDRWNIWTRHHTAGPDGAQPGDPMRFRYIRLQHPGPDPVALDLGLIQVFGDVHRDPPVYPAAVCDPTQGDGLFYAKVWDPVISRFRQIEVRGYMLWTGRDTGGDPVWTEDSTFLTRCTNHAPLATWNVWGLETLGGSGSHSWNLSEATTDIIGTDTSFESSLRAGAEFELTTGLPFASITTGGAYEYTSGVTEEHSSTTFWTSELEMGGAMAGFTDQSLAGACAYNVRPYAFKLTERSNTGYEHTLYVVDYTVTDDYPTAWTRRNLPPRCGKIPVADRIFDGHFERGEG
jgi:PKD repeat protein